MKAKHGLSALLLLSTSAVMLASCGDVSATSASSPDSAASADSSSSSTGNSSTEEEPIVKNESRKGKIGLSVGINPLISAVLGVGPIDLNAPVTLDYATKNGAVAQGADAAYKLKADFSKGIPADDEDEEVANTQAATNFATLNTIFSLPEIIHNAEPFGAMMPAIPEIAYPAYYRTSSAYYRDAVAALDGKTGDELTSALAELPDESGTMALYGSRNAGYIYDTADVAGTPMLRSYLSGDVAVPDIPALLTLGSSFIPTDTDFSSIDFAGLFATIPETFDFGDSELASLLGQAAYVLSDGIKGTRETVTSEEDGVDYVNVTLGLNDTALSKANYLLANNEALKDIPTLSLGYVNAGFSVYRDEAGLTQFHSVDLAVELFVTVSVFGSNLQLPFDLAFSLELDPETTALADDYFANELAIVDGYAETDRKFQEFFGKIGDYVAVIPTDDPRGATSLDDATGQALDAISAEYDTLDPDVKFALGSTITKDTIKAGFEQGRTVAEQVRGNTEEITADNIEEILGELVHYKNWQASLAGSEVLADIESFEENYVAGISSQLDDAAAALETANSTTATLEDLRNGEKAYSDWMATVSSLLDENLFVDSQIAAYQDLKAETGTIQAQALSAFAQYVAALSADPATTFADLQTLLVSDSTTAAPYGYLTGENTGLTNVDVIAALSSTASSNVSNIVSTYAYQQYFELLGEVSSSTQDDWWIQNDNGNCIEGPLSKKIGATRTAVVNTEKALLSNDASISDSLGTLFSSLIGVGKKQFPQPKN